MMRCCVHGAAGQSIASGISPAGWVFCYPDGLPRHVADVFLMFAGRKIPSKKKPIVAFALSVQNHPLQRFSQVQAVIDEQFPLSWGWVQVTKAACLDAHYFQLMPSYGEESMPKGGGVVSPPHKQEQKEPGGGAAVRARQASTPRRPLTSCTTTQMTTSYRRRCRRLG